jgi:hypothetical protein
MLNHLATVRMTASLAEQLFRTATPIAVAELTERHLDMLQLVDIDIATRVRLGLASDEIRYGAANGPATAYCVAAFNARCGR